MKANAGIKNWRYVAMSYWLQNKGKRSERKKELVNTTFDKAANVSLHVEN